MLNKIFRYLGSGLAGLKTGDHIIITNTYSEDRYILRHYTGEIADDRFHYLLMPQQEAKTEFSTDDWTEIISKKD
jgi:hypothetical protein